jgi:hypothetical protein
MSYNTLGNYTNNGCQNNIFAPVPVTVQNSMKIPTRVVVPSFGGDGYSVGPASQGQAALEGEAVCNANCHSYANLKQYNTVTNSSLRVPQYSALQNSGSCSR